MCSSPNSIYIGDIDISSKEELAVVIVAHQVKNFTPEKEMKGKLQSLLEDFPNDPIVKKRIEYTNNIYNQVKHDFPNKESLKFTLEEAKVFLDFTVAHELSHVYFDNKDKPQNFSKVERVDKSNDNIDEHFRRNEEETLRLITEEKGKDIKGPNTSIKDDINYSLNDHDDFTEKDKKIINSIPQQFNGVSIDSVINKINQDATLKGNVEQQIDFIEKIKLKQMMN